VHTHLAGKGFAPQLHSVITKENLWNVVVMDYIPEGEPFSLKKHGDLYSQVENAVEVLHTEGYVHGDLRSPNIIVHKSKQIFILDFDWAGKEGEVFYPLVNPEAFGDDCESHGIAFGEPIKKEHDLHMLRKLKET